MRQAVKSSYSANSVYLKPLLIHALLGLVIFLFKPLSVLYALLILSLGTYQIIKKKDANNEVLMWCAYVICAEVFLRMTKGNIGNEYAKYCVIIFVFLGIYFKGISKKAIPYFIFLLFLIPGVLYGVVTLSFDVNIRKALVFNILGPVCLGISCLYTTDKQLTLEHAEKLTKWMLCPLIAMVMYLFLYNPSTRDVVTGTESNFATSGGFGPNQVSTVLGLGIFLTFVRFFLFSKSAFLKGINFLLLLVFSFRGIVTFSRGGVYTGIAMIIMLIVLTYPMVSIRAKMKVGITSVLIVICGGFVFMYSILQTNGMVLNRYKGEDALGRQKATKFSGREQLAASEIQMFYENPITGVGVGRNKEYREELTGIVAASHNEITRMLAEHGILGVFNLIILLVVPVFYFIMDNKRYVFFFSFLLFWFLTINHAAMRIAAPAFIYSLTLLKFSLHDENSVHRKSAEPPRTE